MCPPGLPARRLRPIPVRVHGPVSHDGTRGKRVCALRASRRYGRYVRLPRTGCALIDARAVKAAERLDGKFVVHGNDDTLSAADMALGYKQWQRVEQAWRQLKSGRPEPLVTWGCARICARG